MITTAQPVAMPTGMTKKTESPTVTAVTVDTTDQATEMAASIGERVKIMKNIKKLIALLMIIVTVLSMFSVFAFAATSGGANTKTIYVSAGADWSYPGSESITLKQDKCTVEYKYLSGTKWKYGEAKIYPYYDITVKNNKTGKSKSLKLDSSSLKIKLDRNTNYTITVSYNQWWTDTIQLGQKKVLVKYKNSPKWWVSSAWKTTYR